MSGTNPDYGSTEDIYAAALRELEGTASTPRLPSGTEIYGRLEEPAAQPSLESGFDYQDDAIYANRPNFYGFVNPPVGIVTTDDLEKRKPPLPRLFKGERVSPVMVAQPGEVRFSPQQPRSIFGLIVAIVVALLLVAGIGYVTLVATKRAPVPAVFMYGSTRLVGTTLSSIGDVSKVPQPKVEDFEDAKTATPFVAFVNDFMAALAPVSKSYGDLGYELSRSNVPDLDKIHSLNELARAQIPQTKSSLQELSIPESLPSDAIKSLGKALNAANAMLDQGTNVSNALSVGVKGSPSGFGDASFAAENMKRNRDNVFAEIRRAERALGLKKDSEEAKAAAETKK